MRTAGFTLLPSLDEEEKFAHQLEPLHICTKINSPIFHQIKEDKPRRNILKMKLIIIMVLIFVSLQFVASKNYTEKIFKSKKEGRRKYSDQLILVLNYLWLLNLKEMKTIW